MLFRGNVMDFSGDPDTYCLSVMAYSNAGALIEGNLIHVSASQVPHNIVTAHSVYNQNERAAGVVLTNNTISTDSDSGDDIIGISAVSCCVGNNCVEKASIDLGANAVGVGNYVTDGSIFVNFMAVASGNRIQNGCIKVYDQSVVTGNIIAAPSDAAAILSGKYGGNDIAADRTPSITGNSILSGSIGIHLNHNERPSNINMSQTDALISGNRIWGCETPIQIDDNWSRCMVTGNMFPAGSASVDNGTDNIVRLNSNDPGDSSGGGGGVAGVSSFKGRTGAVVPQTGDYTAAQVGAIASGAVQAVQVLTQAEYDALGTKSASTLYLIKE